MTFRSPSEFFHTFPPDIRQASLMRFFFPSAHNDLSPLAPGLPRPVCSTFRFSQPLSGLLLISSWGLFSYLWHSWDSPYRGFPLRTASHPYWAWFPRTRCIMSPPARRRLVYRRIVKHYRLLTRAAKQIREDRGFNLFPSPFTSCIGFTRNRRPILSWVFFAFSTLFITSKGGREELPFSTNGLLQSIKVFKWLSLPVARFWFTSCDVYSIYEAFELYARTLLVGNILHGRYSSV